VQIVLVDSWKREARGAPTKQGREEAKWNLARHTSLMGPMASCWLSPPPHNAKCDMGRVPGLSSEHFKIALRVRTGTELPVAYHRKGRDNYGRHFLKSHLLGWSTKKHDLVLYAVLEMLRASGCRTRDMSQIHNFPPLFALVDAKTGERATEPTNIRADGEFIDSQQKRGWIDVGITIPTDRHQKPLQAAAQYERTKKNKYESHRAKVVEAGGFYPTTTTLPIIFETYGAAGVNAQELIRRAVNLWEDYVHGERDPAATAIFAAGWKHKISTVLQWGNAQQIMSVARGEGAIMSRERSHMIAMDIIEQGRLENAAAAAREVQEGGNRWETGRQGDYAGKKQDEYPWSRGNQTNHHYRP